MFCLTLQSEHYEFIKKLGYKPVGLGDEVFNKDWFTDKSGTNISNKNKNYGEYTFHYWIWKNYLNGIDEGWVGFCQYRKFWSLTDHKREDITFQNIEEKVLKTIPDEYEKYETILGTPMFVNQWKIMKFLKKGLKIVAKKPALIFDKNKRNLKFHFDLMHGYNNLEKAIDFLDEDNKNDFRNFVNTQSSFNPHNMFICKSTKILERYYSIIFPWLKKCEDEFGFSNKDEYGTTRIYGFLAERFMSYWFQKNTKYTTMPVIFFDINNTKN